MSRKLPESSNSTASAVIVAVVVLALGPETKDKVEDSLASFFGGHGVVRRPLPFDTVAVREKDPEAQRPTFLGQLEVETPLGPREQRSREVDQHTRNIGLRGFGVSGVGRTMQPRLEYVVGGKLAQAQVVASRIEDRRERREAHELG